VDSPLTSTVLSPGNLIAMPAMECLYHGLSRGYLCCLLVWHALDCPSELQSCGLPSELATRFIPECALLSRNHVAILNILPCNAGESGFPGCRPRESHQSAIILIARMCIANMEIWRSIAILVCKTTDVL
jgi:hypothetical protein